MYWRLGDMTPELAIRIAKMTLAGPAMGADELPAWPLSVSESRDERLVSIITDHLGYDELQYEELQDQVWDMTFTPAFKRAFIAAETLLQRSSVIGRQGIAIVEWAAETAKTEMCAA